MFSLSLSLARRQISSRVSVLARSYAAQPTQPPPGLDEGEKNIFSKLTEKFSPVDLKVQDVSGGCGTFYAISITSDAFKGLPIIKQHRLVNETLKREIEGIHGLQLKTTIPSS